MQAGPISEREPMRVALDATPLLGQPTGVGAFCAGALDAMAGRPELDVAAFAVSWRRRHAIEPHLPEKVRRAQRAMPARPLQLSWAHLPGPPVEWFIGPADVVHGTNYVVPPTRRAARVVTVHDLTSVRFPQLCDGPSLAFPRLVRRAVDGGAWVHTPSHFVREEVVAEFGVDPARVRAVHHGIPGRRRQSSATAASPRAPDATSVLSALEPQAPPRVSRYLLAIGTVEPRKDYPLLVRAFDRVAGEVGDVALVIAGADGWGSGTLEAALGDLRRRERVLRLGYVGEERLGRLLAHAAAVAYPSVYEGFGFVPLQAMAAGVPVVATAAGAVPEVAGGGALLVPPGDPDALAHALATVLDDPEVRAALIARGQRRASCFTWAACAEGLSALYAEAVGAGSGR